MSIVIFGKGYLGKRLASAWPDAHLSDAQIDNPIAVRRVLREFKPIAVINAAGITGTPNVDWCESHQSETYHGNVIAPLILADTCKELGVHLIHLGSGCIFYGPSPTQGGWREEDPTTPVAYYSRTKYAADLLLGTLSNVTVARIRLPIDSAPSPKNLIDKLASYKQVIDVENSVTFVDDLIPALRVLADKKPQGIFHVVNPQPLKYRDLLSAYEKSVDPTHTNEWISEADLVAKGLAAKTRSSCVLNSDKLASLGIQLRPTSVALQETMQKYAQAKRNPQSASTPSVHFAPKKKELKGIITAGGSGTRLMPLTTITNKHLLPIYNKPMILYPLQTLLDAGVKQIMLTTGPEHAHAFVKLLGSGSKFGCHITYRIQDQAGGIAQAVGMAKDFVGDDHCVVHLGDNIFEENIAQHLADFRGGALNFYKEVANPSQYGVVEIDDSGNVLSIEEKPANPKSKFAQLGLYVYDSSVFDVITNLKPSARGELEIAEVNDEYRKLGKLKAKPINGRWFDTGTFQDLKRANEYFAEREGIY
jgi:glucose-1-phosphate thymidylyltransferase